MMNSFPNLVLIHKQVNGAINKHKSGDLKSSAKMSLSLSESSNLDFGCGTGAFYEYLKSSHSFIGRYTGIDISPKAIEIAKSIYSNGNFLNWDILLNELPETYDYIFVSGTFNNEMKNHLEWVYANLRKLFKKLTLPWFSICSQIMLITKMRVFTIQILKRFLVFVSAN